jgi:hypothetical protein
MALKQQVLDAGKEEYAIAVAIAKIFGESPDDGPERTPSTAELGVLHNCIDLQRRRIAALIEECVASNERQLYVSRFAAAARARLLTAEFICARADWIMEGYSEEYLKDALGLEEPAFLPEPAELATYDVNVLVKQQEAIALLAARLEMAMGADAASRREFKGYALEYRRQVRGQALYKEISKADLRYTIYSAFARLQGGDSARLREPILRYVILLLGNQIRCLSEAIRHMERDIHTTPHIRAATLEDDTSKRRELERSYRRAGNSRTEARELVRRTLPPVLSIPRPVDLSGFTAYRRELAHLRRLAEDALSGGQPDWNRLLFALRKSGVEIPDWEGSDERGAHSGDRFPLLRDLWARFEDAPWSQEFLQSSEQVHSWLTRQVEGVGQWYEFSKKRLRRIDPSFVFRRERTTKEA